MQTFVSYNINLLKNPNASIHGVRGKKKMERLILDFLFDMNLVDIQNQLADQNNDEFDGELLRDEEIISGDESDEEDEVQYDEWSDLVVGRRVSVFWPLDKVSYQGKIKAYDCKTGKHTIKYEDDTIEKIDLRLEDYELL